MFHWPWSVEIGIDNRIEREKKSDNLSHDNFKNFRITDSLIKKRRSKNNYKWKKHENK